MSEISEPRTSVAVGEHFNPSWSYQFLDFRRIEAGEFIAPGKIDSELGREYAALSMIRNDLKFSSECLTAARKLGMPNSAEVSSKALIFSAVVAYARPFVTGVRPVRLSKEFFAPLAAGFDHQLHDYLIDVRNKHVAHSVNEFERCDATTVMVGSDDKGWRLAGIGVVENHVIGLTGDMVDGAIRQAEEMAGLVYRVGQETLQKLFAEQREKYSSTAGQWAMIPMYIDPSRANVGKRRD
jgi:hypothetical protein